MSRLKKVAPLVPQRKNKPVPVGEIVKQVSNGPLMLLETKGAEKAPPLNQSEFENPQLHLFQNFLCNTDEQRTYLSNAIDLWDSVPRYSVSRQAMTKARINGRFLEEHQCTFQHRGRLYTCTIY